MKNIIMSKKVQKEYDGSGWWEKFGGNKLNIDPSKKAQVKRATKKNKIIMGFGQWKWIERNGKKIFGFVRNKKLFATWIEGEK